MQRVSPEELLASPLGKWAATDTSVVWCYSPTLGGVASWGRPTAEDTKATFHLIDLYRHPAISHRFSFVMDSRDLEGVDGGRLGFMIGWIRDRLAELRSRITLQVGIVPDGAIGVLLAGILPASGDGHPLRIFTSRREAFNVVAPEFGEALRNELHAAVEQVRGVSPQARRLRELLRKRAGDISLKEAARCLGLSTRSLQRALSTEDSSFRDEQLQARFAVACDLLENTDVKVTAVAARLGITERALSQLFNALDAPPPTEFRRRRRNGQLSE